MGHLRSSFNGWFLRHGVWLACVGISLLAWHRKRGDQLRPAEQESDSILIKLVGEPAKVKAQGGAISDRQPTEGEDEVIFCSAIPRATTLAPHVY
jgi:hypothetical protein